jgi:hypothetical protein
MTQVIRDSFQPLPVNIGIVRSVSNELISVVIDVINIIIITSALLITHSYTDAFCNLSICLSVYGSTALCWTLAALSVS